MTTSIRPLAAVIEPTGPPPTFMVRTDRASWEVEVAIDPVLFNGALAPRRSAGNFCASGLQATREGVRFTLPADGWERLRRRPALFYRARGVSADANGDPQVDLSVTDDATERAPSISVGRLPLADRRVRQSTQPWLRTVGNAVIDDAGRIVVLRGIN